MNYAPQEKRIAKYIKKWVPLLGLQQWRLEVNYVETYRADDPNTEADTSATWQYLKAVLRFYLPCFVHFDDDYVEAVVVHELVHVLVNPMESTCPEDKTDQRERAVEEITQALLRVALTA